MTVQAAGARRLATKDPDRARDAFAAVETTGREALTELRRLLGVLRKEDEDLALAPQPSLAHLDALARRWQAAGLPVALEVTGEVRALPAGVDLTAYRLVQEALGPRARRRRRRAGERADRLRQRGRRASTSPTTARPQGRRLLGMRERVSVYGGELAAAPADGGGLARLGAPAGGGARVRRLEPAAAWTACCASRSRPCSSSTSSPRADWRGPAWLNVALLACFVPLPLLRRSHPLRRDRRAGPGWPPRWRRS